MADAYKGYTYKKLVWENILFFGITSAIALIGLPIYAWHAGLDAVDWSIFAFMAVMTMMATTLGYHRLFAHRAFEAHPVVTFLCLFFGAAAFEGTALMWATQHRDHHRYTDTDRDPYNIKRGFWYAHMDWFLRHRHVYDLDNVKDLAKNPLIKHQHDHWISCWAIPAGFGLPLLIGALTGHFWGAFFLGVCGRFFFIHQSVFLINSACHMFGKPVYDTDATARDSWVCALLTHGEGYHSFHHRFPSDYRNGVRWYQWDPTKWTVRLLSLAGLTRKLKRTPEHQIHAARSEAERHFLLQRIRATRHPKWDLAVERISKQYEQLKDRLKQWELRTNEYRRLILTRASSNELVKRAATQTARARREFLEVRKEWRRAIEQNLLLVNLA